MRFDTEDASVVFESAMSFVFGGSQAIQPLKAPERTRTTVYLFGVGLSSGCVPFI